MNFNIFKKLFSFGGHSSPTSENKIKVEEKNDTKEVACKSPFIIPLKRNSDSLEEYASAFDEKIDVCKEHADPEKYFKLFAKHLKKFENDGLGKKIALIDLSNVMVDKMIIDLNPKAEYVLIDNFLDYKLLKAICPEADLSLICTDDDGILEQFEKLQKLNIDMKFDYIIMNPPYNGNKNLYGKITLEAKKHAKEVVCLSPYLNYLENSQRKDNHRVAAELMPKLKSYELVSSTFDAAFDKVLCVFHFSDLASGNIDINDIYWNSFRNPKLTKSIISKYSSYTSHCYDKIISKLDFDKHEFKVAFSGIRGNADHSTGKKRWDWTTLLDKDKMTNFKKSSHDKGDMYAFPFETENECKNFVSYVNTDIFEYMILIQKNSMNTDKWLFKKIPYMPTYSKIWSEDEIAKELGLSDEELNYIHDEMKNFGWKTQNCKCA